MDEPLKIMGTNCAVHTHHSLVPIEIHHIWPLGLGGPNTRDNRIPLCSNAHSAVHSFLTLLIKGGGKVKWTTARQYGHRVRDLALQGYEKWRESNR